MRREYSVRNVTPLSSSRCADKWNLNTKSSVDDVVCFTPSTVADRYGEARMCEGLQVVGIVEGQLGLSNLAQGTMGS